MLFRSRAVRELDAIVRELKNYLSNNYKDQAHRERKRLGERTEELHAQGKLKGEDYLHYRRLYEQYTESMKNYHH